MLAYASQNTGYDLQLRDFLAGWRLEPARCARKGTISEIEKITTTIMSDEGGLKPLRAVFMNGFLSFTPQDLQRRQMKDELICDPVVGFQRQPYKRRAEPVSQLVPPFYSACIPMYLFAFSV
jgi:hypothetical protein